MTSSSLLNCFLCSSTKEIMALLFAPEKQKTDASLFGYYAFGQSARVMSVNSSWKGWHLILSALPGSLRYWGKEGCLFSAANRSEACPLSCRATKGRDRVEGQNSPVEVNTAFWVAAKPQIQNDMGPNVLRAWPKQAQRLESVLWTMQSLLSSSTWILCSFTDWKMSTSSLTQATWQQSDAEVRRVAGLVLELSRGNTMEPWVKHTAGSVLFFFLQTSPAAPCANGAYFASICFYFLSFMPSTSKQQNLFECGSHVWLKHHIKVQQSVSS